MIPFCQIRNSRAKECNMHRLHAKCGMFSSSHPIALGEMNCEYFRCLVAHTNTIRTVANYPDGSPCGEGNYCIKGECRVTRKNFTPIRIILNLQPLLCQGSTIAQSIIDCPAKFAISPATQALLSRKRKPFKSGATNSVVHNGSIKGNPLKPSKNRASKIAQSGGVLTNSTTDHPPMKQWTRMFPTREQTSEWTEWSPFSECISYACGQFIRHSTIIYIPFKTTWEPQAMRNSVKKESNFSYHPSPPISHGLRV